MTKGSTKSRSYGIRIRNDDKVIKLLDYLIENRWNGLISRVNV